MEVRHKLVTYAGVTYDKNNLENTKQQYSNILSSLQMAREIYLKGRDSCDSLVGLIDRACVVAKGEKIKVEEVLINGEMSNE